MSFRLPNVMFCKIFTRLSTINDVTAVSNWLISCKLPVVKIVPDMSGKSKELCLILVFAFFKRRVTLADCLEPSKIITALASVLFETKFPVRNNPLKVIFGFME